MPVSVRREDGLDDLLEKLKDVLASYIPSDEGAIVTSDRQLQALNEGLERLENVREQLQAGQPIDILSGEIRLAVNSLAEIIGEIRNLAGEVSDRVWVEKIVFDTRAPVDVEQLLQGQDLIAELLRSLRAVACDPPQLALLADELRTLGDKAALELREADVPWDDPRQLAAWLAQAESLLVSRLTEAES